MRLTIKPLDAVVSLTDIHGADVRGGRLHRGRWRGWSLLRGGRGRGQLLQLILRYTVLVCGAHVCELQSLQLGFVK